MPKQPKIIFSHPTGNANVRAALQGLTEAELIQKFHTAIATFPGDFLHKLGSISLFSDIKNRSFQHSLKAYTKTYPFYEVGRLVASKLGLGGLTTHEYGYFCIDRVYQQLDLQTASLLSQYSADLTGVYAFEDGAVETFKKAKVLNLDCLYDLPIGYWRAKKRLLLQAKENHPAWAETIPGLKDSEAKLLRKDRELELADHIFVASSFTAKTLEEYPGDLGPVHIIPYGFSEVSSSREYNPLQNRRRLKILFVGSLSERKGIAELFEAVEHLKNRVELTVVGKKPVENCEILNRNLAEHQYIPSLPHSDILKLMRKQDLFLFPSLFEGFGLVITEAMSQGTPVITTDRTAGPDIIKNGHDGWIIPAGSSDAIVKKLEDILSNPTSLKTVGQAAMATAKKRPWRAYGKELAYKIIQINNLASSLTNKEATQ